jgi:hypothetical protein
MANLNLFIDTTSNGLIAGLNAPVSVNPSSLPFFYGDTLGLQVYLLNTTSTTLAGSNPYTVINTAGLQLFAYLDNGLAGVNNVIYTQQISWATDPTNSYFYSTLSLNTAALQTLLGTATSANCYLQIGYVQNGLQTTVLSIPVTIAVGIPSTNLVVPAGLIPLSVQVAQAMFVPIAGQAGNGFYLISPLGKKLLISAIDNPDGTASLQASPAN